MLIDNKPPGFFWETGTVTRAIPYGDGHINDTWLVDTGNGRFILQRINGKVFNTENLVSNYQQLVPLVNRYQLKHQVLLTPRVIQTKYKKYHVVDAEGRAWRLVNFIDGASSYNTAPDREVSFKAARAFGRFQVFLNTLPPQTMKETIGGFHNLPNRLSTFKQVIQSVTALSLAAAAEIEQVMHFAGEGMRIAEFTKNQPVRIIHNDTKLNNVLFRNDESLVIDLDTVMPGKLMFDFGDMVRSYTSPVAEDEPDLAKTTLRSGHFEAIAKGYLSALGNAITPEERASLLPGAKYIIYEQAIRFLTDYLQGDVYYKTSWPGQNLLRARTQLKLLQSLLEQEAVLVKMMQ